MNEDRAVCVAPAAVTVAEPGCSGKVRFQGVIPSRPEVVQRPIERLAARYGGLDVVYEGDPRGYGLPRRTANLGPRCEVAAPFLVLVRAGERVKADRRDAVTLAGPHDAGELTAVWVPDPMYDAIHDLVRMRTAAVETVRRARQQLQGYLLQEAGDTVDKAERCRDRLGKQNRELVPDWPMVPVVAAPHQLGRHAGGGTAIACKTQIRLCARFRRLMATSKSANLVTAAIAREMASLGWMVVREVGPAGSAARAGHSAGPSTRRTISHHRTRSSAVGDGVREGKTS
jgi:hypothetical protein